MLVSRWSGFARATPAVGRMFTRSHGMYTDKPQYKRAWAIESPIDLAPRRPASGASRHLVRTELWGTKCGERAQCLFAFGLAAYVSLSAALRVHMDIPCTPTPSHPPGSLQRRECNRFYAYYMSLCFYVFRAFLPSLSGVAGDAHHVIK